ncbi:MAG TPA: SHOCT domain-containing protein [Ktedonobacterales bacterium]|nr:SHOCT domain-containing protein [Ktedonobacterales bacterium]
MMWGYPTTNWWGMGLFMLLNAVVWIAIVGLLVWALTRWLSSRTPTTGNPSAGPSAMEILRMRYARGEIDADTFERMRSQLEGTESEIRQPPIPVQ